MGVIFQLINFYFWLHWVFVAAHRLSLAAPSRGYSLSVQASHCGSFPVAEHGLEGTWTSVIVASALVCASEKQEAWPAGRKCLNCPGV